MLNIVFFFIQWENKDNLQCPDLLEQFETSLKKYKRKKHASSNNKSSNKVSHCYHCIFVYRLSFDLYHSIHWQIKHSDYFLLKYNRVLCT
jgi:hypothetical protein